MTKLLDYSQSLEAADQIDGSGKIVGTSGNDSLTGTDQSDAIKGQGGDDTITGGGGSDLLLGDDGNDSLTATDGGDTINGGEGSDTISAQGAADLVIGGAGDDVISGVDSGDSTVLGGAGHDVIAVHAKFEGLSTGYLDAGSGDDEIILDFSDNTGAWRVVAGNGNDLIIDTSSGAGDYDGGAGKDTIYGGNGDDTVHGGDGDDVLLGAGGHQFGDAGNDTLKLAGVTTFEGGSGVDTIDFYFADQGSVADLEAGHGYGHHLGTVTFSGVEDLIGEVGDDRFSGDDSANRLIGDGGNDLLVGRGGDDRLEGGAFADTLVGGLGQDKLDGGESNDTFAFENVAGSTTVAPDLIVKLQLGDVVDLSAIDADVTLDGDQAFALVGAFTGHAGEFVVSYDPGARVTHIEGDVDGDGVADFDIDAKHDHSDFANFVL